MPLHFDHSSNQPDGMSSPSEMAMPGKKLKVSDLESNFYRTLAKFLHQTPDRNKTGKTSHKPRKKLPPISNIVQFNRRLIIADKVPDKLKREFQDAQKHLDECPSFSFRWNFAKPEKCHQPHTRQTQAEAGIAHLKGIRPTMEDTHIATVITININGVTHEIPLYGIFDGHGGPDCALYLEKHLKAHLTHKLELALKQAATPEEEEAAIFNVLKLAFVDLGAEYLKSKGMGGSTANIALIFKNHIWVANVGDTRAILVKNGRAIALSEDAKPALEKYKRGVENRHSMVLNIDGIPRVGGNLATARAIGHDETTSGVNPRAKVIKFPLDLLQGEENTFLVIACDGLWDVASANQVAHMVNSIAKKSAAEIAETLVLKAFMAGSEDNVSALVFPLKPRNTSPVIVPI